LRPAGFPFSLYLARHAPKACWCWVPIAKLFRKGGGIGFTGAAPYVVWHLGGDVCKPSFFFPFPGKLPSGILADRGSRERLLIVATSRVAAISICRRASVTNVGCQDLLFAATGFLWSWFFALQSRHGRLIHLRHTGRGKRDPCPTGFPSQGPSDAAGCGEHCARCRARWPGPAWAAILFAEARVFHAVPSFWQSVASDCWAFDEPLFANRVPKIPNRSAARLAATYSGMLCGNEDGPFGRFIANHGG